MLHDTLTLYEGLFTGVRLERRFAVGPIDWAKPYVPPEKPKRPSCALTAPGVLPVMARVMCWSGVSSPALRDALIRRA